MTLRLTVAAGLVALGGTLAWATSGRAEWQPPSLDRETVTVTVESRSHGHSAAFYEMRWRRANVKRRVLARKLALSGERNTHLARRVRVLDRAARLRWEPTATYAIALASRVFGVDEGKMRAVAYCESTMRPWAANGRYRGLFQLGWEPYGFSPYDPVASALSTAQTVVRDGSWRQWECG